MLFGVAGPAGRQRAARPDRDPRRRQKVVTQLACIRCRLSLHAVARGSRDGALPVNWHVDARDSERCLLDRPGADAPRDRGRLLATHLRLRPKKPSNLSDTGQTNSFRKGSYACPALWERLSWQKMRGPPNNKLAAIALFANLRAAL